MPAMTPEQLSQINDLRRRILANETPTAEELQAAIELVIASRGARTAAASAESRARRATAPKATASGADSMEALNALFAAQKKKP